jgi:hypothetical protein
MAGDPRAGCSTSVLLISLLVLLSGSAARLTGAVSPVDGQSKTLTADLDGDGSTDRVTCRFDADEYGRLYMVTIEVNGTTISAKGESLTGAAEIVDLDATDSWREIALPEYGPSDDFAVSFFRYSQGRVLPLGKVPGTLTGMKFDHAGSMATYCRGAVLHTFSYPARFRVNPASGRIEEVSQALVSMGTKVTLRAKLDLCDDPARPAIVATLRAGEKAVIVRTDNKKWCYIEAAGGARGWFALDGCCRIARTGQDAREVFDGLCYAD